MAFKQLYGTIQANGEPAQNTRSGGWTSRPAGGGDGLYLITFEPSFTEPPTVVVTQLYPNDLSSSGGDTRDNAVVVGIDNNELKIKTGNSSGNGTNREFAFIALGNQS